MKLFKTNQIATIDAYTIENEPIFEENLMVRASMTFVDEVMNSDYQGSVAVFCGPGNNGGDGYVIAYCLAEKAERFTVHVFTFDLGKPKKGAQLFHFNKLVEQGKAEIKNIASSKDLPELGSDCLIVDAIFGSGLTRPLTGLAAELVGLINKNKIPVWSVDIPSGLRGEESASQNAKIVKAEKTITFQFPKLSFFMPENEAFVGKFIVKNIGLHHDIIQSLSSDYSIFGSGNVQSLIKHRGAFSHKGTFGHALLISGSYGKMGAAILASKACLRSGAGLLTTHVPHNGAQIMQTAFPEAMITIDPSDLMFTSFEDPNRFSAVGVGPALGTKLNSVRGLEALLKEVAVPLVLDADAINILGQYPQMMEYLPENTILTPHPKEFERLSGEGRNRWVQIEAAIEFCQKHKVIIVLKGAYTAIVNANGEVSFNSTGNVGMATAGSGDVLCGIILGLLSQQYAPIDAARLGVFIHGFAADLAKETTGYTSMIASDIVAHLGKAFKYFE